jgi:hypothetical protein
MFFTGVFMFDISTIKETDSATLKLLHPETNEPIGAEIVLAGANHPKRKGLEFGRARKLRARIAKKGRLELSDPQEDDDFEIDRLVACTLSWKGIARDGKELECNAGEARAIYESAAWIRQQAVEFLGESTNFLQSAKPL